MFLIIVLHVCEKSGKGKNCKIKEQKSFFILSFSDPTSDSVLEKNTYSILKAQN